MSGLRAREEAASDAQRRVVFRSRVHKGSRVAVPGSKGPSAGGPAAVERSPSRSGRVVAPPGQRVLVPRRGAQDRSAARPVSCGGAGGHVLETTTTLVSDAILTMRFDRLLTGVALSDIHLIKLNKTNDIMLLVSA